MLQILRRLVFKGNPKFPCCFCLYDNFEKNRHHVPEWEARNENVIGVNNIINPPLINSSQIVLPTLHIKLGLFKQFIKYMNKETDAFRCLREILPTLILLIIVGDMKLIN